MEDRQADLGLCKYSVSNDLETKPWSYETARTIESLQFGEKR